MTFSLFKSGSKTFGGGGTEPLVTDKNILFTKLWVYPGLPVAGSRDLSVNVGSVKIGKQGSGVVVCPDVLANADLPIEISVAAGRPPARLCDIVGFGAENDGVYFDYTT